jgi:PAS domain S-box-containing protein
MNATRAVRAKSGRPAREERYSPAPTMSERHRELQRYVRFGPEDSARVAAAYVFAAPHLKRVSDVFYERIREHDEAHAVLKDEEQIDRLRGSLVKWLADLFLGPHDDVHFARAARIGQVHVHVGLPARYMVTAMNVVRNELTNVLVDADKPKHAASLALLLDVELAVMLDTYWDYYATRVRRLARQAQGTATLDDVTHAIEELGVIVIGLDERGRIRLFNDEAERTTGYGADEILGRNVTTLFPQDESETIASRLRAASLHESPEPFDAAMVTRVGRTRDVRARFKQAKGGPRGLATFLTATDVTEEIALQNRTRQAERLAAIGRLAAGLAHEIRNPLNGAHLHLTLLERTLRKRGVGEGDEALEAVRTVSHEVQRLSTLVTEFLQFARPQPLTLRPTVLGEVCQHAARILGPDAERLGVALTLDLPLTPILVRADRNKLSQVLMNLVRNAIEAIASTVEQEGATAHIGAPLGHVTLRVRRQPRDAIVEIEDDGPGIAKPDAPIFDAFFSTKPTGTGLGLPIAHRIVQDHGGTLSFESRTAPRHEAEGRATVFRIRLPVLDGPDDEPAYASSERPA